MTTTQPTPDFRDGQITPVASPGEPADLRTSLVLTNSFVATGIIAMKGARRLTLWGTYLAAAVGGFAQIVPLVSGLRDAPTIAAGQKWYGIGLADAVPSDAALGAALATIDNTAAPSWRQLTVGGVFIRTFAAVNNTDKIFWKTPPLDVSDCRWLHVQCREAGGVSAGTLEVLGSLS